jgi:uncharacterized repeat protein (TIGR01451 family)
MFLRGLEKIIYVLILVFGIQFQSLLAWTNGNFGTGDLTGWTFATVTPVPSGSSGGCLPSVTVVGNPAGPAIDTLAGQLLNVPLGSTYACQLYSGLGDQYHDDYAQISQSDAVPGGGNSTLIFSFAGVFENYHYLQGQTNEDAYLQINVIVGGNPVASLTYNWGNNLSQIVSTGNSNSDYYTACAATSIAGFLWGYVPWTNYAINLSSYVGQQATLQATMYDCYGGGHYGVGYLDDVAWAPSVPSQVTLTKSSNPSGFVAGGPITYTLSYANPAASGVAGVEINDTIPTGTTLVSGSITSSPSMPITSMVGNDLIWNINYLPAGALGTLSFAVMPANCPGAVTNVAKESDLDGGNVNSNSVINTIATCSPTPTPTITNTPTITPTFTNTPTITPTFTPTNSPTPTPTYTPTCVTNVWPDPYNPKTAVGGTLRFSCMNDQTSVLIYTISGELVQMLNMNTTAIPCTNGDVWGTNYCWNGRNKMGFPVATGIYLYVVKQGSQIMQNGKFLIVNGP